MTVFAIISFRTASASAPACRAAFAEYARVVRLQIASVMPPAASEVSRPAYGFAVGGSLAFGAVHAICFEYAPPYFAHIASLNANGVVRWRVTMMTASSLAAMS